MGEHKSGGDELPPFHWQNMISMRAAILAIVVGVVVGGLAGMLWQPLGWLALPAIAAVWAGVGFMPPLSCPECGKRTKLAAERCHHCGVKTG